MLGTLPSSSVRPPPTAVSSNTRYLGRETKLTLARRLRHPQSRTCGRGSGVDEGGDDAARADAQRGQDLAEERSARTVRLPRLLDRTSLLQSSGKLTCTIGGPVTTTSRSSPLGPPPHRPICIGKSTLHPRKRIDHACITEIGHDVPFPPANRASKQIPGSRIYSMRGPMRRQRLNRFSLHYAYKFYRGKKPAGLQFSSGDEHVDADYWDFVYFSFVIGMTVGLRRRHHRQDHPPHRDRARHHLVPIQHGATGADGQHCGECDLGFAAATLRWRHCEAILPALWPTRSLSSVARSRHSSARIDG